MTINISLIRTVVVTAAILVSCSLPAAPTPTEVPSPENTTSPQAELTAPPTQENTATSAGVDETPLLSPDNLNSVEVLEEFDASYPHQLKWSGDSQYLAARTVGGVALYNVLEVKLVAEIKADQDRQILDFSPDSRLAAFSSDRESLELTDIEDGLLQSTIQPGYPIYGAVFLPGGKQIAILNANEISFSIWDIDSGEMLNTYSGFETAAPVYNITFSEDGKNAVWFARATVQTTRLSSGQMGPVLSHQEFVGGLATLDEKDWLAAASAKTSGSAPQAVIQLWDTGSGEEVGSYAGCEIIPMSLDFSPDGQLLAADCQQKVIIWDAENQEVLKELDNFSDSATSVSFSPNGSMLATASNEGSIRIWSSAP